MKALLTAFALLSFVAATTVPVFAAETFKTEQTASKKHKKKVAKKTSKKSAHRGHKKMAQPA
jgi:hypothetical protein